MNKREFLAQVKGGEISPLYLFLGEEYEQEEALRILKEALFGKGQDLAQFNCDLLYGDETTASSIMGVVDTFPFEVEMRLVIIKRIAELPKPERTRLASYLNERVCESTCLVMAGRLEKEDPLYKATSCRGGLVNFWLPFDEELPSFIVAKAKERGKGMEIEAARCLLTIKGKDLYELMNEIDKLVLYVGEAPSINSEDVLAASGGEGTRNIFDLLEAIGGKDTLRGLSRLHQLLLQGTPSLMILSMVIREIHLIYQMGFLLEEGKTPQEIMGDLGISSKRRFSKLMVGVRSFKGMNLRENLGHLLEADIALKSLEKRYHPLILELLVMRLCGLL